MEFKDILRTLRVERKLTQAELANLIGATQGAVKFWENGRNEPKLSYLIELARVFGVSIDYLAGIEK